VDAHIHQWDPFTTPRVVSGVAKMLRRAPFLLPVLSPLFPRATRDFIGDPRYVMKPYLPGDYSIDASPAGVAAVVHVEAGWHGKRPVDSVDETRWVSSLPFGVNGAPALAGIVVHADPSEPGVADVLDAHLAASPLVRGVRCMAAHSSDRGVMDWTPSAQSLTQPAFLRGFAAVASRNLTFDIWVYGHQLPDALVLAREYPDTTFVLDHYATPVGVLGRSGHAGASREDRTGILHRWRDDIGALAELPNVFAKHSGIGMPVLGAGPRPRDQLRDGVAPLITHVQQVFGRDRTFWSSNFPIDKANIALPESISILREVLGNEFDDDRILRDNARRVYRL
jgi:predicted TIM-barrel fold metal-dependent hydrolase